MVDFPDFVRQGHFIDGLWVDEAAAAMVDVVNPRDGTVIGRVPNGGGSETRRAIAAAEKAFCDWKRLTASARSKMMLDLAGAIRANRDALAELLTAEQGKALAESKGEVDLSAAYIQWFAEEARRIYGDTIPSPWGDRRIMVVKEPVGVVGAITPWNFPSSMIARKLGAALAAGCTIVIKPALQTPFSGLAWGGLGALAGLPPGVINVVTGNASEIGDELIANDAVKKITFTGSTQVGTKLAAAAAAHSKRISMELGGNAPFIVFDDADVDAAVAGAMASKFRNSGQTCVSANRIYVHASIADRFQAAFTQAAAKLTLDEDCTGQGLGPLIDGAALKRVAQLLDDAVAQGARLAVQGGHRGTGSYFAPAVLTGATAGMRVVREEIFGPIAPIIVFHSEDEVIEAANDTRYGLACYFYTNDIARAFRVAEALQYGQVGINAGFITTEVAPFGGVKESGVGSEGSKYGCQDYLNMKYICLGEIR